METPSATAAAGSAAVAVAAAAAAAAAAADPTAAASATAAVVPAPVVAAPAAVAVAVAASASRGGRAKSSTTKKRHALPLSRSSSTRPPDSGDMPPTPTDQMAPSSFAYETPSPSSSRSVRGVRARQNETAVQSPDDADSRGGRSLRKKVRIDYSFDHIEAAEAFAARVTPSAARSLKKRKTDTSFHDGDGDEEHELRVKRRASEQPLAAAGPSRRKAAARKNTVEPQMYVPEPHLEEAEAEVQDTIEVGGRHSMHSDDSFRARTSSGGSSHHDLTPKAGPPLSSISQPQPPPTPSIPPPSSPSPQQPVSLAQPVSVVNDVESVPVAVTVAVPSALPPQQETNALISAAPASALNESAIEDDEPEPEPVKQPEPVKEPEPVKAAEPAPEQVKEPVKELDPIQPAQEVQVFTEPAPAEPIVESVITEPTLQPEEKQPDPPLQVETEPPPQPKQEQEPEPESLPLSEPFPETLPGALPEALPEPKETTPPPPASSEPQPQPDPKSPVKSSSPKASRIKAPAVETHVVKPIKEELKEKPVAKPTPVKNAPVPAVTVSKPAEPKTRKKSVNDPLGHLTPYVDCAFVWLPKLKASGEADADGEPEAEPDQDAPADGDADATLDDADEPAEVADEDTPIGTPLAPETAANSPAPELDLASLLPSKRQFAFRKTREAAEFTALFDDVKSLSNADLYYRLEVANRALQAWQNEFNKLRLITEDEDNSMRYHQEEAAFRQREKMALSKDPSANPLRKDYIVKGLRAAKPDAHLSYMRQQDKVMAQAYGFDYDDRESKIGQQDPHAQRTGAAGKARLRDRPKQTAKAAESDDPAVISGKRARKAPILFDGLESVSRSSTPAPTSQPKGDRRRRGAGQGGDEMNDLQSSPAEANNQVVPVRKGKGGRPRKHPLPAAQNDVTSAPAVDDGPALPTPNILERPARKRRRRDLDEEDEALANGTASEASKKAKRRNSRLSEVPMGSFYSQSSTYADEDNRPATASSTASNTTADSSPNNYSLREKRQKKFTLDDGEYDDIGGAEDEDGATASHSRPAKRARRGPRKTYFEPVMPLADEYMVDVPQSEQLQTPAPKPTPKIKIKNYQPPGASPTAAAALPAPLPPITTSVPISSPYSPAPSQTMDSPTTQTGSFHSNGHTPQTEPELEKDYSTMTKSEKMSYSMKARWASGSMSAAVSKRRATLAAKKSARAATPPKPAAAAAVATPGVTEPPASEASPPTVAK